MSESESSQSYYDADQETIRHVSFTATNPSRSPSPSNSNINSPLSPAAGDNARTTDVPNHTKYAGGDDNADPHEHDEQQFGGSTAALLLEPEDPALFLSYDESLDLEEGDVDNDNSSLIGVNTGNRGLTAHLPIGIAPLPPYAVQLFLVSSSLLLGASMLQDVIHGTTIQSDPSEEDSAGQRRNEDRIDPGVGFKTPPFAILWTILVVFLSTIATYIWVLSARYLHKWSLEEVLAHAIVGNGPGLGMSRRGRSQVWRTRVERWFRHVLALLAGLLCLTYLQEASFLLLRDALEPNLLGHAVIVLFYATLLAYFVLPSQGHPLHVGSKRLWICAGLTIAAHLGTIGIMIFRWAKARMADDGATSKIIFSRASDSLSTNGLGSVNWNGFATLAFIFSQPFLTYPLYISRLIPSPSALSARSLSSTSPSSTIPTSKLSRVPYPIHAFVASLISTALLVSILIIPPTATNTPSPVLRSISLLFGIPPLWHIALLPRLPSPSLSPSSSASSTQHALKVRYKPAVFLVLILLAIFVPHSWVEKGEIGVVVWSTLTLTFVGGAIAHIVLHWLRSPLSILLGASGEIPTDVHGAREVDHGSPDVRDDQDEADASLLRRKERSLQRRRLGRRIIWDLLVWLVLLPLGLVLSVWSFGRMVWVW